MLAYLIVGQVPCRWHSEMWGWSIHLSKQMWHSGVNRVINGKCRRHDISVAYSKYVGDVNAVGMVPENFYIFNSQKFKPMANTYTQLHVHVIFSTENRKWLLPKTHREEVEKFISGTIANIDQKLLAIYCMPNHTHLLLGLRPDIALSKVIQKIKGNSSRYINKKSWMKYNFSWQKGFGAFSHSRSQLPAVINYIANQEEHHHHKTFEEEYLDILDRFGVDYDKKYALDSKVD